MKSLVAYENKKIPKTHDLIEIHAAIKEKISFQEKELDLLDDITAYHIEEFYPIYEKNLPPKEEIEEVIQFTEDLLQRVCHILNINEEEVKK